MYRPKQLTIKNIISFQNVEFEFNIGKALIITGLNLDDPSQKSNGVGKSALIESLALAFTGSSIRDVKTKELITNDCDSGEVELVLSNTKTNIDLKIWRKIHSSTKSAECKIWLGQKEVKLADINSYNKWIFDEIGLSKDDFFKFFLITSDNYEPFLMVGDSKKKEIINRFSGADSIDVVFPIVKHDADKVEVERQELEKQIVAILTKAQIYSEQITVLEAEDLPEVKLALIAERQSQITSLECTLFGLNDQLTQLNSQLQDQQNQINAYNLQSKLDDHIAAIAKLLKDKDEHVETKRDLQLQHSKIQDNYKDQIANIKTKEQKAQADLIAQKKILKDYEEFESEVNKKLADSIECPKCAHKFSLRDKEFNVEEAAMMLPDVQATIGAAKEHIEALNTTLNTTLSQEKQSINQSILRDQESLKSKIDAENIQIIQLDESIHIETNKKNATQNSYDVLQKNFSQTELSISFTTQKVEQNKMQLTSINVEITNIEKSSNKEKIAELEASIKECFKKEDVLKIDIETIDKKLQGVKEWETNFKNFKSHVANQSIKNISDYTNLFLQNMGTDLAISIDGYKTLTTGKIKEQITTSVLRNGFDAGSYGKFSGGERGRIDVCVILAIQELINLNCQSGLDLLILDEILDQVDTLGLESIINALQGLGKTVLIVSQNEINTLKEYTVVIQKKNKISTIL